MTETVARVRGLPELARALAEVPEKMQRNVMRGAVRAAAKVVLEEARQTSAFADDTGALRKSLRVSTRMRRGTASAKVKSDLFYSRMIEMGTARHIISVDPEKRLMRKTRKGWRAISISTLNRMVNRGTAQIEGAGAEGSLLINGRFVGPVVVHPGISKRPFLRPALDSQMVQAVEAAREYIRRRLAAKGIDVPGPGNEDDPE